MKLLQVIIYLLLCGMLLAMAFNYHHKKCGTKGTATGQEIIKAALLPVTVGFFIVVDSSLYLSTSCVAVVDKEEDKGAVL